MTTRAHRRVLAWAAAAALTATGASAWAADPGPDTLPISVIAVQTNDADDQAEALTKALRNAVRAMPGWSLGEGDFSLEVLTLSLKCPEPPDANCQSRIADQIKSDRYVWGMIGKKANNVTGSLYLWVRGKGTSKVPVEYTSNLTEANDDALKKIAVEAINELTGGPPKGGIHVRAGDVAGQVFVDGQPLGALKGGEGTFMIPSGPHKITVKAQGYADAEMQAVVKPTGAPTDVTLVPIPMENKSPTNWRRVGGFTALGAGVAFGAFGLVSSIQISGARSKMLDGNYLIGVPGQNVCDLAAGDGTGVPATNPLATKAGRDEVKGLCDKRIFETMQFVFYPLAAVAGGLGIYLVATSRSAPKKPTTGWVFNPMVGPQGGMLDATYTW